MFYQKFEVTPSQVGFLYKNNQLEKQLEAGIHNIWIFGAEYRLILIPIQSQMTMVVNQEVLTKDNIALRFSYLVQYKIDNPVVFVDKTDVFDTYFNARGSADFAVHNFSQVYVREEIVNISAEELNEKRSSILTEVPEALNEELKDYGILVEKQLLKDLTFPKNIQNLFAKRLEAQVRAKTDLENARTTVATARTLKNASALLKGDENIKFIQLLETMTKISAKGNHTFVLSDFVKSLK